jgi:SAM-dependent methyltransferase
MSIGEERFQGSNMRPEEKEEVAAHQRRRFNELVDIFDTPQPPGVMERLKEIVSAAKLRQGEVVLDVGTGVGVLIPLIKSHHPSVILACDLAEKMLQRVQEKYPEVRTYHADIAVLPLESASVDAIFMNAMYGNIADKPRACQNAARMLRLGGRLIISHPEGRAFVDQLRLRTDLFIESLPDRAEGFQVLLRPYGLSVTQYRDEPRLYLMVAAKTEPGRLKC